MKFFQVVSVFNTAKLLIQAKAAINLQDENGETVLMKSAKLGHKDLVDVVIRQNQ
jgi:ankyrin repeat protein